ncbi:PKD domain-containing protein [Candidatus Solirubrobacter pratensis]|uniref:PKD domain-containing protein n=1 Tax=Candidatus Solirubrobacter pratensis TaxID=1298857 RepID=UPI0003FD470B|nr:PKD domain-containing protein [Candidatus Solirubrobacter pratensis]
MLHGRLTSRRLARITGLSLLAALLLAAALSPVAARAAFPGQDGRLAYIDHNNDIRVALPDGSGDRVVYASTGLDAWDQYEPRSVAVSPDGERIAFAATYTCDGCAEHDRARLAVMSADGGRPIVVFEDEEDRGPHFLSSAAWSPDGKRLAFAGTDDEGEQHLYVVAVSGGTPQRLTLSDEVSFPAAPAWSPDGTRIAFDANADAGDEVVRRIFVTPADGGGAFPLTTGLADAEAPAWSPDGNRIAYVKTPAEGREHAQVGARPATGGAEDLLYRDPRDEQATYVTGTPAWSPSGRRIAVMVDVPGGTDYWCGGEIRIKDVDAAGLGTRGLCLEAGGKEQLDWGVRAQPGETRLVSRAHDSELRGGDGDTDAAVLARGGRYAFYSTRATDVLAQFAADTNGASDVFRRDIASGEIALVSGDDDKTADGASDTPVASPDGRFVAFRSTARNLIAGFEGGDAAVYLRDMTSGDIALVSRHLGKPKLGTEGDAEPLAISDDGRYVLFATDATDVLPNQDETKRRHLYRFDRQTGATVVVDAGADAPAGEARMSGNGRYVAFASGASTLVPDWADHNGAAPSLFRRDLETGATVLVDGAEGSPSDSTAGETGSSLRGFSADGATVLFATDAPDAVSEFADRNGAAPDLYLRRPAEPAAHLVSAQHGSPRMGAEGSVLTTAALSADGTVVAFTSDQEWLSESFNDANGRGAAGTDVWVRRFGAQPETQATLVSVGGKGSSWTGDAASALEALSADGRYAVVRSSASDLGVPAARHGHDVLYRVELTGHDVSLVSERAGDGPEQEVVDGAISGDGQTVAYRTDADNLLDGFLDANDQGSDAFAWVDHTISDADVIAPDITIRNPVEGGIYRKDRIYEAQFTCRDVGGSGLDQCVGSAGAGAPIDTDTVGRKEFTVTATDRAGNTTTRTVVYRVALANDHLRLVSGEGGVSNAQGSRAAVLGGDYVAYESAGKVYRRNLRTGATEHVADGTDPRISADGRYVALRSTVTEDGVTRPALVVRDVQEKSTRVVHVGEAAEHAISRDGSTVVYTAGGAVYREGAKLAADAAHPQVSADGTRVLYLSSGHLYWNDAGATRLVDHAWGKADPAGGAATGGLLSADGATVLFGSTAPNVAEAYHGEGEQLYRIDMTAGGATLVTSAHDDPAAGTGGHIATARLSGDGATATWQSAADDVIAGFADHNGVAGEDLYARRRNEPARLVAHGDTPQDGVPTHPTVQAIDDEGRFVLYGLWELDADSEPDDPRGDLRRTDLLRDRVSAVASSPLAGLFGVSMSADGRRIAFDTTSANMIDDFADGNGDESGDVYDWFDKPPVADASARITGPLALAFDGSGSTDSDGEILTYRWDFGDGEGSNEIKPSHMYADEGSFVVKLTVEDDGSNAVTYEREVVAIKGVLTAGTQPLDFLGVDKNLRCSAVRGKELFAAGGGACGTFVALGGKVYGPPEHVDGVTPYTPVRQDVSQDGDLATLVTVVALGDTGVQVRQTDQYVAGAAWYRTDVALVNGGDAARDAIVYRAARCKPGHPVHDAGTAMAGCDVTGTVAALLPLTPGARHQAGGDVLARLGQPLDDTCACDATDPEPAIGWAVGVPAHGEATRGSLGAFGPDGTIPLTVRLEPDKAEVQPLDQNGFTVTVRNANGVARDAGPIVADSGAAWDYDAGSTTGLTTADPVAGKWDGPFSIAGHGMGELHFGITHRNGERVAITTATAAPAAGVTSTGIADLGETTASVTARPIEGAKPNTAIYGGPTGPTNGPEPRLELVASKDHGITYECRFVPAAWEACDSDFRPGPLADRTYQLEVRAVDAFGADETPATRTFTVDTVAPNTVIASGPKQVTNVNRAGFALRAGEPGSRFECRLDDGAWTPCTSPWTTDALADGEHRFQARAIDAADNVDPSPAVWTFRVDTAPPVTVIDGVTGRVVRPSGAASAAAAGGSALALGTDGAAALAVSCPASGPACNGTVGLAMERVRAGIAKVVPRDAITLARTPFSAQPGETVTVRLELPQATRNQVERVGRMAVFPTLDLGGGPVRGDDVVLIPDPRTARLLDAGRELKVVKGAVTLRLKCAAKCMGKVALAGRSAKFSGRTMKVRIRVGGKRGTQSVRVTTKPALTKRLTVTLRAKEVRR